MSPGLVFVVGWCVLALVLGVGIGTAIRVGREGRRRKPADSLPAAPAAPAAPAVPAATRPPELLWRRTFDDAQGPVTLGLISYPANLLGVCVEDETGQALGLRLDRFAVQDLRDSMTTWLADTARSVNR